MFIGGGGLLSIFSLPTDYFETCPRGSRHLLKFIFIFVFREYYITCAWLSDNDASLFSFSNPDERQRLALCEYGISSSAHIYERAQILYERAQIFLAPLIPGSLPCSMAYQMIALH